MTINKICEFQMFPHLAPHNLEHGRCAECQANEDNENCQAYRPIPLIKVIETIPEGDYRILLRRVGLVR